MASRDEITQAVVAMAMAHLDADIERSPNKEVRVTRAELEAYEHEDPHTRLDFGFAEDDEHTIVLRKTRVGKVGPT